MKAFKTPIEIPLGALLLAGLLAGAAMAQTMCWIPLAHPLLGDDNWTIFRHDDHLAWWLSCVIACKGSRGGPRSHHVGRGGW